MSPLDDGRLSLWGRFIRRLTLDYMTPDDEGNLPDGGYVEVIKEPDNEDRSPQ